MSDGKKVGTVLQELERWRLEAREEDSLHYFLTTPELSQILDGDACYVIGRKGCGKTAIAEHIRSAKAYNIFVNSLSFKNFPFNDIYQHSDDRFSKPSQYITFWKYIIYSAVCTSMAESQAIESNAASALRSHFKVDFDKALSRSVAHVTQGSLGLTIAKAGATGAMSRTFIPNDTPWINRVEMLEDLIAEFADDSDYYVLFDELDEDYKDMLNIERKTQYFELLTGLFKAVSDIRRRFYGVRKIKPVIFLRDNIFSVIDDNDKNKWEDLVVNLTWNEERLKDLTAFRISRALDPAGAVKPFSDALSHVFVTRV